VASRQGLILAKSRRRYPDAENAGGYMLFDNPDRAVAVLGAKQARGPWDISGSGYQATLDEIEAYLRRGEGRGHWRAKERFKNALGKTDEATPSADALTITRPKTARLKAERLAKGGRSELDGKRRARKPRST
jgi:hypothetical protein